MSIFDEQRRIRRNLELIKNPPSKRAIRPVEKALGSRKSIVRTMNRTTTIWRKKGINNYEELKAYLESEPHNVTIGQLGLWVDNLPHYKIMYELYDEDQRLMKESKRRCLHCEEVKPFREFNKFSKGKVDGFQCKICAKL